MADFKNYDPSQVVATFGGILLQGFMEGTFIQASRNEQSFNLSVGAQGDATRVRMRNRSGIVTLTLQAESPTNDLLTAKLLLDELTGAGVGTVLIKDLNGTTLATAENAWIQKPADLEYSTDASPREWVIECAELTMVLGGSLV